jgi:hypothetical protein
MNRWFIGHGFKRLESTSYPWQQAMRKMDKRGAKASRKHYFIILTEVQYTWLVLVV